MKGINGKRRGGKPSSMPHEQLSTILASRDKPAIDFILTMLSAIQERLVPGGRERGEPLYRG